MTARYDPRVQRVSAALAEAQAAFRAAEGHSALPAWLRLQSWRRLADAHADRLHWWYSQTSTDASCTCGLLAALPPPEAEVVPGHREPGEEWRTTQVLVVPAPSDPIGRVRRNVVCQACGFHTTPASVEECNGIHHAHRISCPSLQPHERGDQ